MKAQFKYSLRAYLTPRAIVLSAAVAMNLIFGLLGHFNIYGTGGKATAITLCSIALFGILVVCFVTDFEMLRSLCVAPAGYLTALTPVKSWKMILPRIITIIVEDILSLFIGISGIVIQSFIMTGLSWDMFYSEISGRPTFWGLAVTVLGYAYIIMIILFCMVLSKSLFYSRRAGTFIAILATVCTAYVFSLLDFLLAPFGAVDSVGIFYSVSLTLGFNSGTLAYILLNLCKLKALFLASSYLMERKINI